jgi:hypothetical protein
MGKMLAEFAEQFSASPSAYLAKLGGTDLSAAWAPSAKAHFVALLVVLL